MSVENCRLLAALIAAHPGRKVFGRTRLQKEVKLLQRIGFPTEYGYTIHFYGPYSESLQADIGMLEALGLVRETSDVAQDGNPYYILEVVNPGRVSSVAPFQKEIELLGHASTVTLELAATYDAFREEGSDHEDAMKRLRRKKGAKCDGDNPDKALALLGSLGLRYQ